MYCANCGKYSPDDKKFCSACGTQTNQQATLQSTSQPMQMQTYERPQNQSYLCCPRCMSNNINVQAVTTTHTQHRGCIEWFLWIVLAILTLGLILIIPLITNSRAYSNTHSEAVCQSCGYRWLVR